MCGKLEIIAQISVKGRRCHICGSAAQLVAHVRPMCGDLWPSYVLSGIRIPPGGQAAVLALVSTRFESQLTERLDEDGQTILAKLIESQHEIDSITALENFILGFRLGARITMECMDENDGDIKMGGD